MKRHDARIILLELIFESGSRNDIAPAEIFETAKNTRDIPEDPYIRDSFFGLLEKRDFIDQTIETNAVGWRLDRMAKVSLAIMRVCVYEMFFVNDVPASVAINEAVELAKAFDHDAAPSFINGVMNAVAKKNALL